MKRPRESGEVHTAAPPLRPSTALLSNATGESSPQAVIAGLFETAERGGPSQPRDALQLVAFEGAEGDVHRCVSSPRQVLLLSEADRAWLGTAPGAAGENILVRGLDLGKLGSGAEVRLGAAGAAVRLTQPCEPCFKLKPALPTGRSLKDAEGRRGYLATVSHGGRISVGDAAEACSGVFEALPEGNEARFRALLPRVPRGRVVTYLDLVTILGLSKSAVRVLPLFLKRGAPLGVPVHRVVDSSGSLVKHVAGQRASLEAEGVVVEQNTAGESCGSVDLARFRWCIEHEGHKLLFGTRP